MVVAANGSVSRVSGSVRKMVVAANGSVSRVLGSVRKMVVAANGPGSVLTGLGAINSPRPSRCFLPSRCRGHEWEKARTKKNREKNNWGKRTRREKISGTTKRNILQLKYIEGNR